MSHRIGRVAMPVAILFLAACGGGGDSVGQVGALSLGITDAPVDGVDQVWVQFTGVTLKPKSGPAIVLEFDEPLDVDLKALTAGNTEILLDEVEVPAGRYNWIRLHVNAEFDGEFDSYVMTDEGQQIELRVPSGDNTGLKLVSGFTVLADRTVSFIIDWNLRMGLVAPPGQPGWKLQPALRIIDMAEYGSIAGTVNTALLTDESCTSDPNTGAGNEVYVFAGDVVPDDIDDDAIEPLATAPVRLDNDSGNHRYRAGFLPVGQYTVAFTCQAGDDDIPDPDDEELDADNDLAFTDGMSAVVEDGQTTIVNF